MDLVGIEVKTAHDLVTGDERGDTWGVRGAFRQVIDHPPGTATGEKSGERMSPFGVRRGLFMGM